MQTIELNIVERDIWWNQHRECCPNCQENMDQKLLSWADGVAISEEISKHFTGQCKQS